jgi:hypothetical protein
VQWTAEQQAELAASYARIGYVHGELWPAPPPELSPDELLALLRRIPDGAGRAGYMSVLADAIRTP